MLRLLVEKAEALEEERNRWRLEVHRLEESVMLATADLDGPALQRTLLWFNTATDWVNPAEHQQALRWLVKGIEWGVDGRRTLLFHGFKAKNGEKKNQSCLQASKNWFDTVVWTGCSGGIRTPD